MPTLTDTIAGSTGARVGNVADSSLIGGACNSLNVGYAHNVPALFNVSTPDGFLLVDNDSASPSIYSWALETPTQEEHNISVKIRGVADPFNTGQAFGQVTVKAYEQLNGGEIASASVQVNDINTTPVIVAPVLTIPSGHTVIRLSVSVSTSSAQSCLRVLNVHGDVVRLVSDADPTVFSYGAKTDHSGLPFYPLGGIEALTGGSLSAALGFDLLDNIQALKDRPRPVMVWSSQEAASADPAVLYSERYSLPTLAIVRSASTFEEARVYIRASNPAAEDRIFLVAATSGSTPFPVGGVRPQSVRFTIPANTAGPTWFSGVIKLPNDQRHEGGVHRYAQVGPVCTDDARLRFNIEGEYLEPERLHSFSVWGAP